MEKAREENVKVAFLDVSRLRTVISGAFAYRYDRQCLCG